MESVIVIGNKAAIVVIATLIVWVLQRISLQPNVTKQYPFLKSPIARLALSLMGASFAVDFFSFYVPAPSELVLNAGVMLLLIWIYAAWKTGKLVRNQNVTRYEKD